MTALFEDKNPDAFKQAIAEQFKQRSVNVEADALSWGQFLDNLGSQGQVGLYGTVSACIVFKLVGGPNDANAKSAHQKLVTFWNDRANSLDAQNNLAQNVRIAMLLLGLAISHPFTEVAVQETWRELLRKLDDAQGMWGDSLVPNELKFVRSEYVTSIISLLLFLVRHLSIGQGMEFAELDSVREKVAKALQRSYLSDRTRQRPYKLAMLLAIVANLDKGVDRKIKKYISAHAIEAIDIKQRYTYFIDYKKTDDTFSRDFLIVPIEVFCTYLLFSNKVPGMQYLLSVRVLTEIEKCLKKSNDGLFKAGVERPSTIEQSFIVLALDAYGRYKPSRLSRILPWVRWWATRDIESERLAASFILLGAYCPIGLLAGAGSIGASLIGSIVPHWVIYALYAFESVPKWLATVLTIVTAATGTPQELLKVLISRRGK